MSLTFPDGEQVAIPIVQTTTVSLRLLNTKHPEALHKLMVACSFGGNVPSCEERKILEQLHLVDADGAIDDSVRTTAMYMVQWRGASDYVVSG